MFLFDFLFPPYLQASVLAHRGLFFLQSDGSFIHKTLPIFHLGRKNLARRELSATAHTANASYNFSCVGNSHAIPRLNIFVVKCDSSLLSELSDLDVKSS